MVRRSNEDALFARAPVFAVADGMGGAQAGEVAAGMAARAFEGFVPQTKSPEEALTGLITRVNGDIYALAVADAARAGMGTTLTAAVVRGGSVIIAHVGDSRAYRWRGGALTQLTEDHSLVGEMLRSGRISAAEAEDHPQRSIITRALGVDPEIEVDTQTLAWAPGDIFLLCSDGLYSMVPDDAIAAMLTRGDDLSVDARALVEAANAAGGHDNISVVLFSPDGSVPADSGADPSAQTSKIMAAGAGGVDPTRGRDADPARGAEAPTTPAPTGLVTRFRNRLSTTSGFVFIGLVLTAVLLAGAWFATRQVYYLGVEGDHVAIFRGVPYVLGPWPLSNLYRASAVKLSELEPFEQERINRQELQSRSDAEKMLDNYSVQARERKEEADRKAAEDAQRAKTTTQKLTVPPGDIP